MGFFSIFAPAERLENQQTQAQYRNQTSPINQATVGAAQLIRSQASPASSLSTSISTLPDGRLNVGTHLPLLAKRYKYLSTLGEGVSAQVLLVEDTFQPGRLVTVKIMKRRHAAVGHREARALRFLQSRGTTSSGLVKLIDTFTVGAHFCLVLERLYPRFLDWIAESTVVDIAGLRKISYQLLSTVAYLHGHGIVHADIKPDNVLMKHPPGSRSVAISLVDFGGAYSITETDMSLLVAEVQTLPYRAPEVALGLPCGAVVDEWSVGVVLAEAALKRPLFPCSSPIELLQSMVPLLGPLPNDLIQSSALGQHFDLTLLTTSSAAAVDVDSDDRMLSMNTLEALFDETADEMQPQQQPSTLTQLQKINPLFGDLIGRLLSYDPHRRISASEALHHPYFTSVGFGSGVLVALQQEKQVHKIEKKEDEKLPPQLPRFNNTNTAAIEEEEEEEEEGEDEDDHAASAIVAVEAKKPLPRQKEQGATTKSTTTTNPEFNDGQSTKKRTARESDDSSRKRNSNKKPWWMV